MKKTIIAVATLAAASLAQATDTTWTSQSWTPASTGQTSWEGSSADKLIFNGTSSSNKNGDEWTNAQLFIQGTEGNSQKSTITGGTLEFISQNPATNDANNAPGVGYNAVVLGGNSSLTIDVGTLLLGDSVIDQTDKKGGDRGIRLSGSNNTLTIYADRIVSPTLAQLTAALGILKRTLAGAKMITALPCFRPMKATRCFFMPMKQYLMAQQIPRAA